MQEEKIRCRMCYGQTLRTLGQHEGYTFTECADCGFVFIPSLGRAEMERQYREGRSSVAAGAPSEGWAYDLTFLAPAFERLGTGRHHLLDFGCGHSKIPQLLRDRGHRVVAVDVGPPQEPHPDRLTGDLLTMALEADTFDLIYAYQVFEHLPEPRPILDELLRLARPGGLLLIHTNMDTPLRAQGFFDWFYVLPPDHCAYYRKRTFTHVLRGEAAEIVWSDPYSVLIQLAA